MTVLFLFAALISVGLIFYFHGFFRRAFEAFSVSPTTRRAKVILWVLSLAFAGTCVFFTSILALFVLHLFAFALVCDLVRTIGLWIAHKRFPRFARVWKRVLFSGIPQTLLAIALILGGALNMANVQKTDYKLETQKDIAADGYRVALLADLHYGVSLDFAGLEALCDEIEAQAPDLLILCGDIVDESTERSEIPALFSALSGVKTTYGVFYVYGNHDRLRGNADEDLGAIIEKAGVTVLCDEGVQITEDLYLVGREDRSQKRAGGRLSIDTLLSACDQTDFLLVLDHQPSEYAENAVAGTDLLLSGHTHGGQLFPLNLLQHVIPFNDAVYGETPLGTGGKAIVTSGVAGWKFPIKTAAPAEYVIIDIVPAK